MDGVRAVRSHVYTVSAVHRGGDRRGVRVDGELQKGRSAAGRGPAGEDVRRGARYFARAVRTRVLPFTARNACVCLFTLGLAAENNDVMRTASEAYPWYVGNVRSLYFRILLALRDRETDRARMMYAELKKTGGAAFDVQRRLCERIFRAVDTGDPTDRFYEDSDFPVVRKIYDMYTSGADDAA